MLKKTQELNRIYMKQDSPKGNSLINRRSLLKGIASAGAISLLSGTDAFSEPVSFSDVHSVFNNDPVRITKIEGIRFSDKINIGGGSGGSFRAEFCWVRLHTNKGVFGTGETYPFANGELGALKDYARLLIGKDPRDIDGIWKKIYHDMSMRNAGGADMRILSAINMAQVDLAGKLAGVPAYRLLGGKTRPKIKVYNTTTDYWAINNMKMGQDTEKIVKFLLDRGITGMKIYPFHSKDEFITSEEIDRCLLWLKQIRAASGNKMEILLDCWGRFDLPSSQRILKAIEPYNVISCRRHDGCHQCSASLFCACCRKFSSNLS
jgi:galactonate dehydratase